ncbi:hypothetical protein GOODEAATRI_027021 [Goodea atripinnis]|uniref:Uncharacterized protein n=1 Tax=Goodea atripinnis TaxID=208336 RepID=A0ABV0PHL4_9TELE
MASIKLLLTPPCRITCMFSVPVGLTMTAEASALDDYIKKYPHWKGGSTLSTFRQTSPPGLVMYALSRTFSTKVRQSGSHFHGVWICVCALQQQLSHSQSASLLRRKILID